MSLTGKYGKYRLLLAAATLALVAGLAAMVTPPANATVARASRQVAGAQPACSGRPHDTYSQLSLGRCSRRQFVPRRRDLELHQCRQSDLALGLL